ncbi:MAG: MarR family transcriptional regulator [Firmicutes bacterium]|nr:MarR family transcriptional regulator [Bacillota bacterium]
MNHELYEKLTRLQWLLHKQQIRGYADGGPMADTARGQGRILAVLKLRDGISTKDLSYLLGVRVSSLNELLSKLEKSGHVTREPSEQDKRVMLVTLTDKGRSVTKPAAVDFGDIFDCLSDEEQRAFGEYLDRVIAALTDKLGYNDEEEFERMKAAREHFAEMMGGNFDGHDFHRMFGGFGRFGDARFDRGRGFGPRERGGHHEHD